MSACTSLESGPSLSNHALLSPKIPTINLYTPDRSACGSELVPLQLVGPGAAVFRSVTAVPGLI